VCFFAAYAPDGMNPLVYSLGYNLTYILPEAIATLIIISIPAVAKALNYVKRRAVPAAV
jgi:thiamine transporter